MSALELKPQAKPSGPARFITGALIVLFTAMAFFILLMRPPMNEIGLMALFLAITTTLTVGIGYGAYRLGWISNWPRLRWALLGTYALSSLLTFFNVWLTARLMFASEHDLLLATVLLLFAGGIAMALGYFFSEALTRRIVVLAEAAKEIAHGNLSVRVPVQGRDEMAELASTFNEMASQLEALARKQEAVEAMRHNLIAWVSHDLQTPLTSIRAIVEALADGVVEEPLTAQRYLRTALRDIRSLSHLIDDLFEMAQLDAGGLQLDLLSNSLSDLISDTLESFREIASKQGVTLNGHVAEDVDPVVLDAERIGRVLSNLLRNALVFTPAGGTVSVHAHRQATGIEVEVSDTGAGISPEELPNIFDQFYRGDQARSHGTGGAGLGLAIVKGLIEAHKGEIAVWSEVGQGTTFRFSLPSPTDQTSL